jgi:hypothetical protein
MKSFIDDLTDMAKVGAILYVLGLVSCAIHFSRYSILALDLTRPQLIVIGIYIAFLYGILPAGILFALSIVRSRTWGSISFCLALFIKNIGLAYFLGYAALWSFGVGVLTTILELALFGDVHRGEVSCSSRRLVIALTPSFTRTKLVAFAIVFSIHFAVVFLPLIPSYLAGAKPLRVHIFPKTADLPANRFILSKNMPKVNPSMDSFAVKLIYESDKDLYFLEEPGSLSGLEAYTVMRLKRDEVLRIDYPTPLWVSLRSK